MRVDVAKDTGKYRIKLNNKRIRYVVFADEENSEIGYFMDKDGALRYDEFGEPIYVYTKGIINIEVVHEHIG